MLEINSLRNTNSGSLTQSEYDRVWEFAAGPKTSDECVGSLENVKQLLDLLDDVADYTSDENNEPNLFADMPELDCLFKYLQNPAISQKTPAPLFLEQLLKVNSSSVNSKNRETGTITCTSPTQPADSVLGCYCAGIEVYDCVLNSNLAVSTRELRSIGIETDDCSNMPKLTCSVGVGTKVCKKRECSISTDALQVTNISVSTEYSEPLPLEVSKRTDVGLLMAIQYYEDDYEHPKCQELIEQLLQLSPPRFVLPNHDDDPPCLSVCLSEMSRNLFLHALLKEANIPDNKYMHGPKVPSVHNALINSILALYLSLTDIPIEIVAPHVHACKLSSLLPIPFTKTECMDLLRRVVYRTCICCAEAYLEIVERINQSVISGICSATCLTIRGLTCLEFSRAHVVDKDWQRNARPVFSGLVEQLSGQIREFTLRVNPIDWVFNMFVSLELLRLAIGHDSSPRPSNELGDAIVLIGVALANRPSHSEKYNGPDPLVGLEDCMTKFDKLAWPPNTDSNHKLNIIGMHAFSPFRVDFSKEHRSVLLKIPPSIMALSLLEAATRMNGQCAFLEMAKLLYQLARYKEALKAVNRAIVKSEQPEVICVALRVMITVHVHKLATPIESLKMIVKLWKDHYPEYPMLEQYMNELCTNHLISNTTLNDLKRNL